MKCSLSGLIRLKPFDESEERPKAGAIYAGSVFFSVAIIACAFLAITALALSIVKSVHAIEILACTIGVSAVTAGVEWHAGLRARALNQLFSVVLVALAFGLLGN